MVKIDHRASYLARLWHTEHPWIEPRNCYCFLRLNLSHSTLFAENTDLLSNSWPACPANKKCFNLIDDKSEYILLPFRQNHRCSQHLAWTELYITVSMWNFHFLTNWLKRFKINHLSNDLHLRPSQPRGLLPIWRRQRRLPFFRKLNLVATVNQGLNF